LVRVAERMTSIALFIDRAMLPGAHVVLFSAAVHHGPGQLDVHVFHSGLNADEIVSLSTTLQSTGREYRFTATAFDPDRRFAHFGGLHGSRMTYGRLVLPELLPHLSRVLYLDADLLVRIDLHRVFSTDLGGHALGAVATSSFESSLDGSLASAWGVSGDTPHFNAGVLLMDLDQWRSQRLTERTLAFVSRHASNLRSHDQSALNFVFHSRFKPLPRRFNVCVEPWNQQTQPAAGIIHFIGSPKPFDPGARWLHSNRREFAYWMKQTAGGKPTTPAHRLLVGIQRLWNTRRSIGRCLLNRILPGKEPLPLHSFDTEFRRHP
jgi:lipopolysaccharide biosynthesis glycosyltransferase